MANSKIEAKGAMRDKRCISYKKLLFTIILQLFNLISIK